MFNEKMDREICIYSLHVNFKLYVICSESVPQVKSGNMKHYYEKKTLTMSNQCLIYNCG